MTGLIKTGAGGVMLAGLATGQPWLVVGGAIVYGGAVVYENREALTNLASSGYNAVSNFVSTNIFGNAPTKEAEPVPTVPVAKTESVESKIVDWSTMEAKNQTVMAKVPKDLSSRKLRNSIMSDYGFSAQDIAAYDRAYPTKPGQELTNGGFYIHSKGKTTWATPAEVKGWGANEYGYTSIDLSGETIAHLQKFYAQRSGQQ